MRASLESRSRSFGGALNTLTFGTPISDYSAFGYSYRTNTQDVDGDGVEDGQPYAQQPATVLGLAYQVQNEAVAGAEAVRDFTFEQHIAQDSVFGVSILDVLNYLGRPPSQESLETRMDLSGQVERTVASFEADGRPENAAAIITIGSNDFISFLAAHVAFISENAAALGALVSAGPLDIAALIADPGTPADPAIPFRGCHDPERHDRGNGGGYRRLRRGGSIR